MSRQYPKIPYGVADFTQVIEQKMTYVDKTRFIPELEEAGHFLFFLRPRRSGKSLLVSTLFCYYDTNFKKRFENLFGNSWLGKNPTEEKNRYMVLAFNFSAVRPEPDRVEASFEQYTRTIFDDFIDRYPGTFTEKFVTAASKMTTAGDRLSALFAYCRTHNLKLYILIDEYDNFTNTILTTHGKQRYQQITRGAGFFRHFFNVLKEGTSMQDSGLARLFITGVSPVTMDDVTSGFNIGIHISLEPQFQDMAGFTESETAAALDLYDIPDLLGMTREQVLDIAREWYGGYRYSIDTDTEVFNPDMVLYFIRSVTRLKRMPTDMTDQNVRMDYGKLRHLLLAEKQLNGNFKILKTVIEQGRISSPIATGFPIEELTDSSNFVSLLFYFGLITHSGQAIAEPILKVPNQTIAGMIWGQLRDAYKDTNVFRIEPMAVQKALEQMGWFGNWKPFFKLIGDAVGEYTAVRDFMHGEKVIQGFLLAYLNSTNYFITGSETELSKGFCDIYLEPFVARYKNIRFGYLIELKYIKRGEKLTDTLLQSNIEEARTQLERYRRDPRLKKVGEAIEWLCPVLVFHGWELVYYDTPN
ncbi:MAG: AAA family ATPase [Acidobacteriota bacterium]|nr:AAA family ATPase [Acidobacteriota bacterium]